MREHGISRVTAKRVMAVLIGLALAVAVIGVISGVARVWSESLAGARPADAFVPADLVPVDGLDPVTWREDGTLGRPLDPATRTAIERAWVEGWIRLDTAVATGDGSDLRTDYAGPALDQVSRMVADARGRGLRQQVADHDLEVILFSADGSIVELRGHNLRFTRGLLDGGGSSPAVSTETWDVIMRLIDGRWRRVSLLRRGVAG